jgi:hypothetical protein
MKKTVREWIEFLNMDDSNYIGLEMENGIRCWWDNYVPAPKCMEEFDGYLDYVVTMVWLKQRTSKEGITYHKLIYTV